MIVKEVSVSGYKVFKTKWFVANNKYRTFILIEFPVGLLTENI